MQELVNTKMPRYWTQNNLKEWFPDKVKLRVRFSLDNLKLEDDVLNIPLFTADQTDRLGVIGLALDQRNLSLFI